MEPSGKRERATTREEGEEKEKGGTAPDKDDHDVVSEEDSEDDKTHFTISQTLFDALRAKDFSENAIKKAIVAGCIDEATCTQWITMHEGHAELNTPLAPGVVVEVKVKRVLTEAERAAKVCELQEKARRKKEEAKAEEQRKARERLELGRKALETKAKIEEIRREMDLKEVQQAKRADAEARRRVKIQITADRYMRQGKSSAEAWEAATAEYEEGLRKAREAAAARLQSSAAPATPSTASAPVQPEARAKPESTGTTWDLTGLARTTQTVQDQVLTIFDEPCPATRQDTAGLVAAVQAWANAEQRTQCLQTLKLILSNIRDSPFDLKRRTLKTSTKAFRQKLMPVPAAVRLLRAVHFDLADTEAGQQTLVCRTVVMRQLSEVLAQLAQDDDNGDQRTLLPHSVSA